MVRGSAGVVGLGLEAQAGQIQIIQEDIDHANGAVFGDVVIEALWKQSSLIAVFAFYKSAHPTIP